MHCETSKGQAGFTLVELMIVVVIALILAAIAVPNTLTALHSAKLRGTASDFGSLLQTARIRAVQADRYYSSYIIAGPPQQAYLDLTANGGTGVVNGDPMMVIVNEVKPTAAGGAPDTANLKGQFLPAGSGLTPKDGSTQATPVIFSSRGLPCSTLAATGGNVCDSAGGAIAFWIFFQDSVTKAWVGVTVNPAGRIQRWQHSGTAWQNF